ncbi:Short-chain collagen C4 [Biomphalaria glabrata]|nr:Short-chain collagen C4 [Biomphalaria glabrata]
MGNKKKARKTLKRQFRGNQHTCPTTTIESVASKITELPNTDSETNVTPGPSAKKIKMQSNILPEERNLNNTNSFILMDTSILFAFLSATVACDVCSQFTLSVELDDERRSGFAHEIILRCSNCNEWETRFKTSSAGAMEAAGAVNIFMRSVETRNIRYTQYLGDGDSSSYKKVVDSKPYGEKPIEKLECVGHVQKRCGTRLRRLVNDNKGRKLDDGKGISGIGRLTSKKIDTLQNYFGFAIRQNSGNLDQMKADVKAVLFHVGSSEKIPRHDYCPDNSWCKYKLDPKSYKHKNGLPEAVIKFLEPIFVDLANEELLRKCTHGKTQNRNENLNKLIWERCPKELYVEKETIEEAVYSAISYFNDGAVSIIKCLEYLGIEPGYYTYKKCFDRDKKRIRFSDIKSSEAAKKRRKTLRAIKKGFLDTTAASEGDMYTSGGH